MESTSKVCHQCGEEIKRAARKCPYCQSWQKGANSILANQPATVSLLALIPITIFMIYASSRMFGNKAEFGKYQHLIVVQDSRLHYQKEGDTSSISTIGTIKNNSDKKWKEVYLEVQYFNESGALIDTQADKDWSLVLPPNSETAFRVRQQADKPASEYKTHKVFVKDAEEGGRWP